MRASPFPPGGRSEGVSPSGRPYFRGGGTMRWIRRLTLTLALSLTLAALGFTSASPGEQAGTSAQLYVFSGTVTVAGEPGAGGLHHRRQGRRLHLGTGHGEGRAVSPTQGPAGGCLQRPVDQLLVRKRPGRRVWRPLCAEGGIRRARAGETWTSPSTPSRGTSTPSRPPSPPPAAGNHSPRPVSRATFQSAA